MLYLFLFLNFLFATDDGISLNKRLFKEKQLQPDPFEKPCPETPRSLTQIKGNLYRHTNSEGPTVHSGFVLITKEGALVIDPAQTCTAIWLQAEIKRKFKVPVKYVVYTHGHFDHIGGGQVFQKKGAIVVANERAVEPIVGEALPTAIPDRVFDKKMTITLADEKIELFRIAPSHSNSLIMVYFPNYKALQCTDACESQTMPYNDFLDFYYDGWIETLDWVITQDVEIIDVGHYTPANKQDQIQLREYLVDLHQQVLELTRKGQSWDQLYRNVKFKDNVQKWFGFNTMKYANILGMYRWVSNHRRGVW